jgi:uncharacterized membrane protein
MFNVGDIITGTQESHRHYGITNTKAIMEVVFVRGDGTIDVKILEHEDPYDHKHSRFGVFHVRAEFFVLAGIVNKSPIERKIAVMYKRFEKKHAK